MGNGFSFSRRDALKLLGGVVVGTAVSPLPWKLLDDVSIWTQNEGWAAPLPRGPITTLETHCPLCPSGCGIRVSMVGGSPFAVAGVRGHVAGGGKLCALGPCGHHLLRHPDRLRRATQREGADGLELSMPAAAGAKVLGAWMRQAARGGSVVAMIDTRPGRSLSHLYRAALADLPDAVYVGLDAERVAVHGMLRDGDGKALEARADLLGASSILSFQAPLLEGWGSISTMSALAARGDGVFLTQVEARPSVTARRADLWIAPAPGTEALLAMAIGKAALDSIEMPAAPTPQVDAVADDGGPAATTGGTEGDTAPADGASREEASLDAARRALKEVFAKVDIAAAAAACEVPVERIVEAAKRFGEAAASVAISGVAPGCGQAPAELEAAVMALNAVAGRIGAPGGIALSRAVGSPPGLSDAGCRELDRFDALEDGSVGLLVIDDTHAQNLPTEAQIARKLRGEDARVVYMTAFARRAGRWDLLLPVEAPFEATAEVFGGVDAAGPRYALAVPLSSTAPAAPSRARLLLAALREAGVESAKAAGESGEVDALVEGRVGAIFDAGRGVVAGPGGRAPSSVKDAGSAKELYGLLEKGAVWIGDAVAVDEAVRAYPEALYLLLELAARGPSRDGAREDDRALTLEPFGIRALTACSALPPAMTKLTEESALLPDSKVAFLSPKTGRVLGIGDGAQARLTSGAKTVVVRAIWDGDVLPGVVHVGARLERGQCRLEREKEA